MSKQNTLRVKNMMYEQQLVHLPNGMTADGVYDMAVQKLQPARCAMIVHDKDITDSGAQVDDHVHMMMTFSNARSINSVAKQLGDKPQYIAKWDDRADNGFAYLVHKTPNAVGKYQYNVNAVRANFDYPALMRKMDKNIQRAKKTVRAEELLDALKNGKVTKLEVERQLSGMQYGKLQPQIDRIYSLYLRHEAEEWRKDAANNGKTISLIWIYGGAGTGKTSLAKDIAARKGDPYYLSGSSRDPFQRYAGQHTVILDELRPRMLNYSDILCLTDPFALTDAQMAPARYRDKVIACDLYIVTSPYTPIDYYDSCISRGDMDWMDSFGQLQRRIDMAILMTMDEISQMQWDSGSRSYVPITNSIVKNKYSAQNRPAPPVSTAVDYYNEILGAHPHDCSDKEDNEVNDVQY